MKNYMFFQKKIKLIKRFDFDEQLVGIYIKFNKLEDGFCFIISFHELEHPINISSTNDIKRRESL